MAIRLALQYACGSEDLPPHRAVIKWIRAALARRYASAEVTVRIVGEAEGADLNRRWRKRRGATNVLSFPSEGLGHAAPGFLGDIVICAPVVMREAHEQLKSPEAHWAHLIVHGALHLLGYEHKTQREAEAMEKLEQDILKRLGYPNPYSGSSSKVEREADERATRHTVAGRRGASEEGDKVIRMKWKRNYVPGA